MVMMCEANQLHIVQIQRIRYEKKTVLLETDYSRVNKLITHSSYIYVQSPANR